MFGQMEWRWIVGMIRTQAENMLEKVCLYRIVDVSIKLMIP